MQIFQEISFFLHFLEIVYEKMSKTSKMRQIVDFPDDLSDLLVRPGSKVNGWHLLALRHAE